MKDITPNPAEEKLAKGKPLLSDLEPEATYIYA